MPAGQSGVPRVGPARSGGRGGPALVLGLVTLLLVLFLFLLLLRLQGRSGSGGGSGRGGGGVGQGTGDGKGDGARGSAALAVEAGPATQGRASAEPDGGPASRVPATTKVIAEEPSAALPVLPPVLVPDAPITSMSGPARHEVPESPPEPRAAGVGRRARGKGGEGGGARGELGTGDVSFCLYWQPAEGDFDLHVVDPKGHHISYNDRRCPCGGEMDRDDTTSGGPENVFWPPGKAPRGSYRFYVEYFAGTGPTVVTLHVYRGRQMVLDEPVELRRKGERTRDFTYTYGPSELPAGAVGAGADSN